LTARGKSAREIGEILNISYRTAEVHVGAAARKLGAVNKTHAVAIALRDGIIPYPLMTVGADADALQREPPTGVR
jgi:DNA-binding NarL/FixJ family response regulator